MSDAPSSDRWHVVSRHLERALALDEPGRAILLASLERQDSEIAGELKALLAEQRAIAAERFLEEGPRLPIERLALAGQTIGGYRIVALVGRGGMGTVWAAERSDGRFERRAAIKFLNIALTGLGDDRFRREGAILARLTHPNIAQLLDAGVSDGGDPYLVLEYVDGESIDRYCERLGLDVHARIRLFLDVSSAVAYAHANLIVHRDLKPSNVLVSNTGTVKLLDFGIAKLLEAELHEGLPTAMTLAGGSALTPDYAAPEQLTGGPVTTATDVYALGVVLFELLSGQHPAGSSRRSAAELSKAIVEADAPRMSQRAGSDGLRRALRGDLDTIVGKALNKNPLDRYASVTAMAADLQRYLTHEPISARPDTIAYRTRKFVRRHRWSVAAGALALFSLSTALFIANRERTIARQRFTQVRQLANKLFDIDVQVRQLPGNSKTRQLIVDTALEYLKRLEVDAGADPDLDVDVGTAYMRVARVQGVPISANLGQLDQAERTLQTAQTFIDAALASRPGNRTAMLRSGQIAHDRMILAGLRRPDDDAIRFAQKSAERLDRYLASGPVDPAEAQQVVIAYMNVANRYMLANQLDEAIAKAEKTIALARANNLPVQAGAALMVVAGAYRGRGDIDEALARMRDAVRVLEPPQGEHLLGRISSYTLALTREAAILSDAHGASLGRPDDALPVLERAAGVLEDVVRQDPADADSRARLSSVYLQSAEILRLADPARALKAYDDDLARLSEISNNSKMRRDEVRALSGSAALLQQSGRAAEARERLASAFERLGALKLYPAPTVSPGSEADDALRGSAEVQYASGHPDEALKIHSRLIALVMAGKPDIDTNLSDAVDLSSLYATTAHYARSAGQPDLAASLEKNRRELWQKWERRLPHNVFVRSQLAAADQPAS